MITEDSCSFCHDHAVYKQFRGVMLDEEESLHIAAALGNKKVRYCVIFLLPLIIDGEMMLALRIIGRHASCTFVSYPRQNHYYRNTDSW